MHASPTTHTAPNRWRQYARATWQQTDASGPVSILHQADRPTLARTTQMLHALDEQLQEAQHAAGQQARAAADAARWASRDVVALALDIPRHCAARNPELEEREELEQRAQEAADVYRATLARCSIIARRRRELQDSVQEILQHASRTITRALQEISTTAADPLTT
jgi:hypothetical protein